MIKFNDFMLFGTIFTSLRLIAEFSFVNYNLNYLSLSFLYLIIGLLVFSKKRDKRVAKKGSVEVEETSWNHSTKTAEEITSEIKSNFSDEEIKEIIRKLI